MKRYSKERIYCGQIRIGADEPSGSASRRFTNSAGMTGWHGVLRTNRSSKYWSKGCKHSAGVTTWQGWLRTSCSSEHWSKRCKQSHAANCIAAAKGASNFGHILSLRLVLVAYDTAMRIDQPQLPYHGLSSRRNFWFIRRRLS